MAINYIVVLMFENRSYDNVLGALYMNQTPPIGQSDLNGLTGEESNPNPPGDPIAVHSTATAETIGGSGPSYPPTCIPMQDPGELFSDMAQQYLSQPATGTSNVYASYDPAAAGLMQGFVTDYVAQNPSPGNPGDVMNYLTPEQMPVTAYLAQNFAVCDEWFASAPTQTFTNRTFLLRAGPAYQAALGSEAAFAWVDDAQWSNFGQLADTVSIFKKLDAVFNNGFYSGSDWKVYFHDIPLAAISDPYVFSEVLLSAFNKNLCAFDSSDYANTSPPFDLASGSFVGDAMGGTLPKLSLIEPRYFAHGGLPVNSNHPGLSNLGSSLPAGVAQYLPPESPANNVPIDAASGELLLMQVYNILSASPNWNETLLIVTYDEAGGTYDHVAPPLAVSPGGSFPAAQNPADQSANGFNFNVFGSRVPAIVISPAIAAGTTIRATTPFDHTSVIRTTSDTFLPAGTSLTARDAAAPSLVPFLTGTNSTAPFSGQIVCAPSAVIILGTGTAIVFASAGTTELSAAMASQPSWVTGFTSSWSGAWSSSSPEVMPNTLTVTLTIDATGITSMEQASFTISGSGLTTVTVPVTLVVS